MNVVFSGVGVVKVLYENACQFYVVVLPFLAWSQLKFLVQWVLVSHQVFVHIIQIDVVFHLVNDQSDSSEGFVKVVVVSDVANGVEDPSQK